MLSVPEMETLRKELGLRYSVISEKTGLPASTLQKVLSGKTRSPRAEVLTKLREYFADLGCEWGPSVKKGRSGHSFFREQLIPRETPVAYYGTEMPEEMPVVYEEWPHEKRTDHLYTTEEFEAFSEDFRVELIDGELYDMSPLLRVHQSIQMVLSAAFYNFIQTNHGNCEVYPAGLGVWLDEDDHTVLMPDITVCCDPDRLTEKGMDGAPDLVVEILSPSNWKKDSILKYKKYVGAGVREYWMVDPGRRTIQVFRKDRGTCCEFYTFDDPVPVGIWEEQLCIRLADSGL